MLSDFKVMCPLGRSKTRIWGIARPALYALLISYMYRTDRAVYNIYICEREATKHALCLSALANRVLGSRQGLV